MTILTAKPTHSQAYSPPALLTANRYFHLKFEGLSMPMAILFSWLIAGGEYTLQVPANRIGALQAGLQPTTLRCIAELATLVAFLIFQSLVLGQPVLLNHVIGFAVVFLGVLTGIYPECAHPTTVSHTHELATGCGATPPTIEQKDGWLSYECPSITPDLLASRGIGVLIVLIGPWTATVGSTGTVGDVVLYPEGGAKSHRPDADARKLPIEETDDVLRPLTLQQAS